LQANFSRRPKSDWLGDLDFVISPITGIGYETGGVDPITGQARRVGVVTSAGVGVGIGKPRVQDPGTSQADRRTMEMELRGKGLPEGNTMAPVAVYLYFAVPQKSEVKYQLEYVLNGNKVVLPL
jgi:hypothetical protein